MPTPTPPVYLVREQTDAICRSIAFDGNDKLQGLLRFIVEQTIAEVEVTEGILATELWPSTEPGKTQIDKTKIRVNVVRLRKKLEAYHQSADALTAIVEISIPLAGLDENTRRFKHYSAVFAFHPAMHKSAATFSQVLFNKYGLPLSEGEHWFTEGTEPLGMLRAVIHRHKASALLLWDLHFCPNFEKWENMFRDIIHCYELAEKILNTIKPEAVKRKIHIELALPYVAEMMHSADTLVKRLTEWVSGRRIITPAFQAECENAFAAACYAFDRFLDKAEVKLVPPAKQPEHRP